MQFTSSQMHSFSEKSCLKFIFCLLWESTCRRALKYMINIISLIIGNNHAQWKTSKQENTTLTTVWLNQEMRPYLLRYPAMAMRAANHVRVSQATDSAKHSFHVTTPVIRRTDNPRIAAVTASTFSIPPKIQSPT